MEHAMIATHRSMKIPAGDVELQADVAVPEQLRGLVVFAHGSGRGRLSPRNRYVADVLQSAGLGTVLVDLLTPAEERGGRPDLARDALRLVHQPVLLIVGGADPVVIDLNRRAMELIPGEVRLEIVPGATHLFEEPGALEQVARLARDWFVRRLTPARVHGQ
jgi:pimeloyl-ACP methyl ester carboxylesterase